MFTGKTTASDAGAEQASIKFAVIACKRLTPTSRVSRTPTPPAGARARAQVALGAPRKPCIFRREPYSQGGFIPASTGSETGQTHACPQSLSANSPIKQIAERSGTPPSPPPQNYASTLSVWSDPSLRLTAFGKAIQPCTFDTVSGHIPMRAWTHSACSSAVCMSLEVSSTVC